MSEPSVAVITDSTAYIPKPIVEELNLYIAPQILIVDQETFRDGIDVQPEEFYIRIRDEKIVAKSSQATVATFKNYYDEIKAKGINDIVVCCISGELSGTYNSAVQARDMSPGMNIEIVDSRTAAMSLGFVALAAARAAAAGKPLAEVVKAAQDTVPNVGVMFTVESLEYLRRGGRIGNAAALLGTAFNLKPVLETQEGVVEPVQRIRTKKKAMRFIVDELERRLADKDNVRLATIHALAEDEAQTMMDKASAILNPIETVYAMASPVVCAHTGPGTVGIAYCHTVSMDY